MYCLPPSRVLEYNLCQPCLNPPCGSCLSFRYQRSFGAGRASWTRQRRVRAAPATTSTTEPSLWPTRLMPLGGTNPCIGEKRIGWGLLLQSGILFFNFISMGTCAPAILCKYYAHTEVSSVQFAYLKISCQFLVWSSQVDLEHKEYIRRADFGTLCPVHILEQRS